MLRICRNILNKSEELEVFYRKSALERKRSSMKNQETDSQEQNNIKCNDHDKNPYFTASSSVCSNRILYTPSSFGRTNLFHLQEIGRLTALSPHTSKREELLSYLCFVVLEGSGQLVYNGCTYPLGTGDVVFIDCMKPYAHSTGENNLWSLNWCHFYGPGLPAIYSKYCERGGQPVIHPGNMEPYISLLEELYFIADSDDYIRDMRINEKLSSLLTCLMGESWHPEKHQDGHIGKRDIQQIKVYLDEHYSEKITLALVADRFFINKHYLAKRFKEQYGVTLTTYLQQVRITHAKRMLRFTDKKVEEIGLECGVGALTYFSRVFKKIEGVSPSEYRNMW